MRRRCGDNRGFALVLTLILTGLMVAVAAELIHQVYVDTTISRGFRDGQQASLLAESGAVGGARIMQQLLPSMDYSSANDTWAKPIRQEDENGSVTVVITEESGRINLNTLVRPDGSWEEFTRSTLLRLGRRLQIPDSTWDALGDWLDKNDEARSGGAESPYYATRRPPYAARNGAMLSLQELSLVKGFTPEFVRKLQPFVTVFTGQPGAGISQVNINSAPREVLMALDDRIDERLADRIIEERRVRPFKSVGELSRVSGMEQISQQLAGKVTVKGALFRIQATAQVRETGRVVESVVRLSGSTPETLFWQEY